MFIIQISDDIQLLTRGSYWLVKRSKQACLTVVRFLHDVFVVIICRIFLLLVMALGVVDGYTLWTCFYLVLLIFNF